MNISSLGQPVGPLCFVLDHADPRFDIPLTQTFVDRIAAAGLDPYSAAFLHPDTAPDPSYDTRMQLLTAVQKTRARVVVVCGSRPWDLFNTRWSAPRVAGRPQTTKHGRVFYIAESSVAANRAPHLLDRFCRDDLPVVAQLLADPINVQHLGPATCVLCSQAGDLHPYENSLPMCLPCLERANRTKELAG